MPKEIPFCVNLENTASPLPNWFSEEDSNYYADKFEKSGFTGGLNYYGVLDLYVQNIRLALRNSLASDDSI